MTVRGTMGILARRGNDILQKDGLTALLTRAFKFLVRYFFQYGTFYIYKHTMQERNESDFMPKIKDFTFQIVFTNEQANELATRGCDFRSYSIHATRRLEKGAIAFCVFVGRELAHVGWVAMSEEAKNTFDYLPYRVDFSNKEACTGGTLTIPKYEGKGLMMYGYYQRFKFLRECGIKASRNVVNANNIASQRVHAKFGPEVYAKARYLKILAWKLWKETQLPDSIQTNSGRHS